MRAKSTLANADGERTFVIRTFVTLALALSITVLATGTSGASKKLVKDMRYGFSFTLPDHWQQIPLTGNDISGLLDLATKADPSMKSSLTKEVKQAARSGVKIFALGPIINNFASNMNVVVEPLSSGPSTSGYFDELGAQVKLNLAGDGMKNAHTAAVDLLFAGPLATPVALLCQPGEMRHGLPSPARLIRVHGNEQPGELTRLPGIHIDARSRPHEIG